LNFVVSVIKKQLENIIRGIPIAIFQFGLCVPDMVMVNVLDNRRANFRIPEITKYREILWKKMILNFHILNRFCAMSGTAIGVEVNKSLPLIGNKSPIL
jgi:hypothetical protein